MIYANHSFQSITHLFSSSLFIINMFGNNPYAQGGWYNPQNPYSINGGPRAKSALSPTFGALPPLLNKPTSVVEFEFTHFNPDIFNCMIVGPQQRKFFEVKTSNSTTVISKPGETFALIKWAQHPTVEAKGVLSLQRTGDFLKLSSDSTFVKFLLHSYLLKFI